MNKFLKFASLATRQLINYQRCNSKSKIATPLTLLSNNAKPPKIQLLVLSQFPRPFCSSSSNNGDGENKASPELAEDVKEITSVSGGDVVQDSDDDSESELSEGSVGDVVQDLDDDSESELSEGSVGDVPTQEFVKELRAYLEDGDNNLDTIGEMIARRVAFGEHEESDVEILEDLANLSSDSSESNVESEFSEAYSTDEEIPDLYNAAEYTENKFLARRSEEYQKKENSEQAQKSLEGLMEDMVSKFLPEDIKQEIEEKFNDLCEECERGDVQPAEAYALFKEFEEKKIDEYVKKLPPEEISQDTVSENKAGYEKDPPGEGPILRWQTRVVLSAGGDAWHPKNRKVKVSVFVKELGLSKYAGKRLRALVGKRYNIGKDELTIVSERFEHREENRKDVLRILYALIDEAKKADKYVNEAYTAYTKECLKSSEHFQKRLRARVSMGAQGAIVV